MTTICQDSPSRVRDHYRDHLAPVYLWMAGGIAAAVARGEAELDDILAGQSPLSSGIAVDLGAGFGMHAIPLARRGWQVIAIDSSSELLAELRAEAGRLNVNAIDDDLRSFRDHLPDAADLILCMGDTLTHLPDPSAVEALCADAARALRPGGSFVLSFRDYSTALCEAARFIPVRSDAHRVLTCFLDYTPDRVVVHDLLHERSGASWQMRVSAYPKLRLAPEWVSAVLESCGFTVRREPGLAGMTRIVASLGHQVGD